MGVETQLIELFHQINRRLIHVMMPLIKERQFTVAEMFMLMRLSKGGPCRITDLASMIGIPASTSTGILDRLEGQGFVTRNQDPDDRRSVIVRATPKVHDLTGHILAPMEKTIKTVLSKMPETRVRSLVKDLQYVLEELEHKDYPGCKEAGKS